MCVSRPGGLCTWWYDAPYGRCLVWSYCSSRAGPRLCESDPWCWCLYCGSSPGGCGLPWPFLPGYDATSGRCHIWSRCHIWASTSHEGVCARGACDQVGLARTLCSRSVIQTCRKPPGAAPPPEGRAAREETSTGTRDREVFVMALERLRDACGAGTLSARKRRCRGSSAP